MAREPIYVTRSSMPPFEEYCEEIRHLWDTHILTNQGAKHNELEAALQHYLGVEHISLFVNGHSALECVIEAMELGRDGRDEVITTPFTFASTTHAIVRKGLKPVFCDIKPDDYTIDPEKIEELITDKTCAILPVHVYGNICDTAAIETIANKFDLKVIFDAAHAFGVKINGAGVGTFGDASMFSFHATKVFNTIEGGGVAYSEDKLVDKLAWLRNFGITGPEDVVFAGGNCKMNEYAAAMGLCNLRHVGVEIAKRKTVTERYRELLEGVPGLAFQKEQPGVASNYAYMPVIINPEIFGATRDDVFSALSEQNIRARKYFYPLTSDYRCYRDVVNPRNVPIARMISCRVLTLPMYADLPIEEVDRICDVVIRCGESRSLLKR